jgi:hypothetical protein
MAALRGLNLLLDEVFVHQFRASLTGATIL